MAETLLFFTELLGMPVHDLKGRRIGRIKDAAIVPLVHPSRVDRYLVGGGWAWLTIRFDQIASISLEGGIHLSDEQLVPYHEDEYMLRLSRDLLDQQIIDVNGRKVVRVNDLTMRIEKENGARDVVVIQEVDVGIRSIIRRLFAGALPKKLIRKLQAPVQPNSIPWDFCNIVEPDPQRRLRLNISNEKLEALHPADLADIMEELGPAERESIVETIDSEVAAEALQEIDPKMQASILESLEPEKAADIIEEMDPDEAADALSELAEETSGEILEEMESEPKNEVAELLEYKEDSAGGMMNTAYLALHDNATVADAFEAIRGNEEQLDSLYSLFLMDEEGRLVASVPVQRLFLAPSNGKLKDLASVPLLSAGVHEKQDRVTELFDKYNLLTLPVLDEEGKLAGVVTADDIISVLRQR